MNRSPKSAPMGALFRNPSTTQRTKSETEIQKRILLELGSRPDVRLWRNNTGAARGESGQLVRFGLPGSADLLGILSPSGRFLAIEVKSSTGRLTDRQEAFGRTITKFGGVYIVARSVDEAVLAVDAVQAAEARKAGGAR